MPLGADRATRGSDRARARRDGSLEPWRLTRQTEVARSASVRERLQRRLPHLVPDVSDDDLERSCEDRVGDWREVFRRSGQVGRIRSSGISRNASAAGALAAALAAREIAERVERGSRWETLKSRSSPGSRMPLPQPAKVQKQKRGWQRGCRTGTRPEKRRGSRTARTARRTPSPQTRARIGRQDLLAVKRWARARSCRGGNRGLAGRPCHAF